MSRLVSLMVIGLILIPIFIPNTVAENYENKSKTLTSGQYDKGYRYNIQGWVYIHIEGEPYKRGYQYGYLASNEINDIFQRWINFEYGRVKLLKLFKFRNPEKLWNFFRLKAKNYFLKYIPNEYIDELKGLKDGLNAREVKIL